MNDDAWTVILTMIRGWGLGIRGRMRVRGRRRRGCKASRGGCWSWAQVRTPDRPVGPGITLIDRRPLDKLRAGPGAGAGRATIVRQAAWTVSEAGYLEGKPTGREKHCGSVR